MSFTNRLLRALSIVSFNHNKIRISGEKDTLPHNQAYPYPWRETIADALIIAGMQFFYTLAGMSAAQVISEPLKALLAAGISSGLGFFTTLALKRGLKTNAHQ